MAEKVKRKFEALEEKTTTKPSRTGGRDCRLRTQRAGFSVSGYSLDDKDSCISWDQTWFNLIFLSCFVLDYKTTT